MHIKSYNNLTTTDEKRIATEILLEIFIEKIPNKEI